MGVGFTFLPGLEVVAGQFKEPTMLEGLFSSGELLLPERSVAARLFGDRREPGILVNYTVGPAKFAAMVSNGMGTNVDAAHNSKDLSLRADYTPWKPLSFGAFILYGDFAYDTKGRWGASARYTKSRFTGFTEYSMGRDNGTNSLGYTLEAAYNVDDEIQPVVRFEAFKQNVKVDRYATAETIGVNYAVLKPYAKMQAAITLLQNLNGNNGSPLPAADQNGAMALINFQMGI